MNIKKFCGYPHNGYPRIPNGYGNGYEYETNIYPADKIHESYYLYPILLFTQLTLKLEFNFVFKNASKRWKGKKYILLDIHIIKYGEIYDCKTP